MEKELKIVPPEGYEIDKENSTFECVKFKRITERWRDDKTAKIDGYFIGSESSDIIKLNRTWNNIKDNYNVFSSEKQAKSALAMARISQIMVNDERFGGPITDEEWNNIDIIKYIIYRDVCFIAKSINTSSYRFLAFHTGEQRDLFLEENGDLIKDYLML